MKKIVYELVLLLLVYVLGLIIGRITPVPSSLASMGILFAGLQSGIIKERQFTVITPFILAHIALFFIAPAIRIINSLELLSGNAVKIFVVLVVSNIVVMGVTGRVVQALLQRRNHATNE